MKTYSILHLCESAGFDFESFPHRNNEVQILETRDALLLDIEADGVRILPIMRKLAATLAQSPWRGKYEGWFDWWANDLADPKARPYFQWNYSGEEDARRGCWSYSWGIEDHEGSWYIFLNLKKPDEEILPETEAEKPAEKTPALSLIRAMRALILDRNDRSAWDRGVTEYAHELIDTLEEGITGGYIDPEDLATPKLIKKHMLNGADDWSMYSWGGCSLCYDGQIARRLCSPSELTKTDNGNRRPNAREEWLDVQTRALFQAERRVIIAWREAWNALGLDLSDLIETEA